MDLAYTLLRALLVRAAHFATQKIHANVRGTEADDYSMNSLTEATFRVLLVNRVVVGKPHRRRKNAIGLVEPPCGYHSVRDYIALARHASQLGLL